MEESSDFVGNLPTDTSIKILRCLDDPTDLRHAAAVSTSWRRFVIENRLFKSLCLQLYPQLADVPVSETEDDLATEHTIYSSLARTLTPSELKNTHEEEFGCPIYSAKAVKFRFGHRDFNSSGSFVWTYTSPEFPMIQRPAYQKFMLPEPALCIGGIMQIELLGRIIKHPLDDMCYICMPNVQALGRNLWPKFCLKFTDESGNCILKHNPYT